MSAPTAIQTPRRIWPKYPTRNSRANRHLTGSRDKLVCQDSGGRCTPPLLRACAPLKAIYIKAGIKPPKLAVDLSNTDPLRCLVRIERLRRGTPIGRRPRTLGWRAKRAKSRRTKPLSCRPAASQRTAGASLVACASTFPDSTVYRKWHCQTNQHARRPPVGRGRWQLLHGPLASGSRQQPVMLGPGDLRVA